MKNDDSFYKEFFCKLAKYKSNVGTPQKSMCFVMTALLIFLAFFMPSFRMIPFYIY